MPSEAVVVWELPTPVPESSSRYTGTFGTPVPFWVSVPEMATRLDADALAIVTGTDVGSSVTSVVVELVNDG